MEKGNVIWITGLSGSGKSTIAAGVCAHFRQTCSNVVLIDGDAVREICEHDLGYDHSDRFKNAQRVSRFCRFLSDQGVHVICATVSLFSEVHAFNRQHMTRYFEVYVDCDQQELYRRDQKGLYSRCGKGLDSPVVGVDLPFEKPLGVDLVLDNTRQEDLTKNIEAIIKHASIFFKGPNP